MKASMGRFIAHIMALGSMSNREMRIRSAVSAVARNGREIPGHNYMSTICPLVYL